MKRSVAALVFTSVMAMAAVLGGSTAAQASSIGIGAGTVDPEGVLRTQWFTANLRWKLSKRFMIEPEVGLWEKTTDFASGISSTIDDRNVGLNFVYMIPKKGLNYFVAAGVGAHLLKTSRDVRGTVTEGDTELKQALHLFGGLEFKVGKRLRLFGAIRFDTVADLNQSKLYGGLRLGK